MVRWLIVFREPRSRVLRWTQPRLVLTNDVGTWKEKDGAPDY